MVNSNIVQNSEMSLDNTGTVSEELRNQMSGELEARFLKISWVKISQHPIGSHSVSQHMPLLTYSVVAMGRSPVG